ncbi:putative ubiquitin carboxyl-terminal hydrolase 12 [Cyphellophora attinorum]|uniref:ubiquitinyl hydrolase 1 n=1 Tax=Cyphellophora attinorum TaxID=1664694 RepID=A0A0N1HAZ9_9EURO|nr:putative ubiquitin carboxyl-terminal hydrolase 12 [Phialophora attinorum]KPI40117.1 putative ubiquitin carboxyl-terminal hydrolase 12 [Phialophora attinorum]
MTTRGRTRREGRPKGLVGLTNLGNTCYMNSGLQSIRAVQELTQYFLGNSWKEEVNHDNPLGHNGQVAKAYFNLIKGIYNEPGSAYTPREFKNTVGRFNASFSGYGQQDSQEFLLFLLNGLAEDLNRIVKKPYIERPDSTDEMVTDAQALQEFADRNWADYKARNDSVITDLFAGMYKSTLTCPVCDKVSIIFDPFVNLTLQLPIETTWQKNCYFVPVHGRPKVIDVEVDKVTAVSGLKEFVSKRVGADPQRLVMAEAYKYKYYKIFDNPISIAEAGINLGSDIVGFYELEDVPTNYNPNKKQIYSTFSANTETEEVADPASPKADKLMVPVFHRTFKNRPSQGGRLSPREFFGYASYIVIDRETNKSHDAILRKLIGKVAGMTTRDLLEVAEQTDSSDAVMVSDQSTSSVAPSTDDGFVDVSMRGESVAPTADSNISLEGIVNGSDPIPDYLRRMFSIGVKYTGEGSPTGWNNINEQDEVVDIKTRVPAESRSPSPSSTGSAESNADESTAESEASIDHVEDASPDPLRPTDDEDVAPMFNNFKGANRDKHNRKAQRVYGKKNKRRNGNSRENSRWNKSKPPRPPVQQPMPATEEEREMLIRPGEAIVCDWDFDTQDGLFGAKKYDDTDSRGTCTWDVAEVVEDAALVKKRSVRDRRKREGVTLEDCLNEFDKAEILSEQNSWYCPRCKEHRRAEKKFELWKIPDVLIMHLKRFSSGRNLRDKLELNVEYPVEGLDMTKYVLDAEGKVMIYDLIAVDNHYGGLGGGHYTAYAKNFANNEWYEFNDGHVSKRSTEHVVASSAYFLIYRRRGDYPLGGPKLEEILDVDEEHDSDGSSHSQDKTAGNGRRLGGSSHQQAGSSGLGGVGAVHHSGGGGLEDGSHDPLVDTDTQMMRIGGDDEEPIPSIDTSYGPQLSDQPLWSFENLDSTSHDLGNISDGSDDSIRAQGGGDADSSPRPSSPAEMMDVPLYSGGIQDEDYHDEDGDTRMRMMRESAPPPSYDVAVTDLQGDGDDDEEELPVAELHSDAAGNMHFENAPH